MTRSFSVPANGKTTSLRVTDSTGLIRVISAKPHLQTVRINSTDGGFVPEIGNAAKYMEFTEFSSKCALFRLHDMHNLKCSVILTINKY